MEGGLQVQERPLQTYSNVLRPLQFTGDLQSFMDDAFKEEITSGDYGIYMDDILIATNGTLEHHIEHINHIFDKI